MSTHFFYNLLAQVTPYYSQQEAESILFYLFEKYVSVRRCEIFLNNVKITQEQKVRLYKAVRRVISNEPVQYITEEAYFMNLPFKVNPLVLIPRKETEELLNLFLVEHTGKKILDIGTGSGCIAIAIALQKRNAQVEAWDISEDVLEIARHNAQYHNVEVDFKRKDIFQNYPPPKIPFDAIVSNPPYVLESEKVSLQKSVLDYEPHKALFVPDSDPLIFYKRICQLAETWLTDKGKLFFEIHERQASNIKKYAKYLGYTVEVLKDIHSKDRFAILEKYQNS